MKKYPTLICSLILFAQFISACGGALAELQSNPEEPQSIATKPAQPAATHTPFTEVKKPSSDISGIIRRELVEKARADLSERLNVDPDQIDVIEALPVDWPDSSLGCPQPDKGYATVITPGLWIVLEVQEMQFPYHTDLNEQIILCLGNASDSESGAPPLPVIPVNPDEIKDGEPWMPVD